MNFNESVQASTLSIGEIVLSNAADTSSVDPVANTFRLTTCSTSTSTDGPTIIVSMCNADLDVLKTKPTLAVSQATTYISFSSALIKNMANINVVTVSLSSAVGSSSYQVDLTPPTIRRFDLNMNATVNENNVILGSALLTLYFSETVNVSTITPSAITIQSSASSATVSATLTGAAVVTPASYSNTVQITLLRGDANNVKLPVTLAKSNANTYLSATSALVRDMYGTSNAAVSSTAALAVTTYTADLSPPQLLSFNANLNNGYLDITFDEVVNGATVSPIEYSLQDGVTIGHANYTLTGGVGSGGVAYVSGQPFSQASSIVQRIYFIKTDLDEIKRLALCKSDSNCFLIHTEYAARDMAGNKIVPCS